MNEQRCVCLYICTAHDATTTTGTVAALVTVIQRTAKGAKCNIACLGDLQKAVLCVVHCKTRRVCELAFACPPPFFVFVSAVQVDVCVWIDDRPHQTAHVVARIKKASCKARVRPVWMRWAMCATQLNNHNTCTANGLGVKLGSIARVASTKTYTPNDLMNLYGAVF